MSTRLAIEAIVTNGSTVTIDGRRYRVTAIGVRMPKGFTGREFHANSPVEYYAESNGRELFSVTKQRKRRKALK